MDIKQTLLIIVILVFLASLYFILYKNIFVTEEEEGFNSYLDEPNNNPNVRGVSITNIESDGFSIKFHAPKGFVNKGNGQYIVDTSDYGGRKNRYKFDLEVQNFLIVVGIYSDRTGENLLRTNTYNINPNECKSTGAYDTIEFNEELCERNIILSDLDDLKNMIRESDEDPILFVKVGVITMYKSDNNPILKELYGMPLLPNNPSISANGGLFPLKQQNISLNDEDYTEFEKFKKEREFDRELRKGLSSDNNCEGELCSSADGKIDFIKANLGGYPDNLFLEERTGDRSLNELIKRQLSLGILNVNVHTSGM